jgi:hypothetical protein
MGSAGVASAADRARLLSDLALALTGASTDLDKLLDVAARAASALVGDSGVVRVADDAGWPDNTTVYDPDPHAAQVIGDMLRAVPQRADEGLSGALAASGKPLVSNAVTLDQLSPRTCWSRPGPTWSRWASGRWCCCRSWPTAAIWATCR